MFTVKSSVLELRGVASKVSSKGNAFYILNVEDSEGNPYSLYCKDYNAIPQGLKKGDEIQVLFDVHYYQGNERLIVVRVDKVTA